MPSGIMWNYSKMAGLSAHQWRALALSCVCVIRRRRQRRERRRSCWTKQWLLRHDEKGNFNHIVREFRMNDDVSFR